MDVLLFMKGGYLKRRGNYVILANGSEPEQRESNNVCT